MSRVSLFRFGCGAKVPYIRSLPDACNGLAGARHVLGRGQAFVEQEQGGTDVGA